MPRKLTQEEVIVKFKEVHKNYYDYSKVIYVGSANKVIVICPIHKEFEITPKNHLIGQGCKSCGYIRNATDRSLGFDEFIIRSKKHHGDRYDYSTVVYTSSGEYITIICPIHGEFQQITAHHMNGHGCRKCHFDNHPILQKMTTSEFITKAKNIHGDKWGYSKTIYVGNDKQVVIRCRTHGEFSQRANDHLSKKAGCPECAGVKKLTIEGFIKRATLLHDGRYEYHNTKYSGTDTKVSITCKVHGNFQQTPHDHLSKKAGCPKCVGAISKVEIELFSYIKDICPDTRNNDRDIIRPLELDIVIPSKRTAFEFNGLYFHSSAFKDSTTKHKKKSDICKSVGYRLIHIYEDDWRFNQDIVKKTINHLLGVTNTKYHARNLSVVIKNYKETKTFYEQNHMQGSGHGDSWCLLDDNEIVAAMQFSMATSERGNTDLTRWELVRYATKGSVVGGASKLFNAFVRDNKNINTVISYSDNDMFDGKMYELLGFTKSVDVKPDYKYIVNGKREHKSKFRKDNIAKNFPEIYDETLTEAELTEKLGYYRIYNSGLTKWEWARNLDI